MPKNIIAASIRWHYAQLEQVARFAALRAEYARIASYNAEQTALTRTVGK